MSLIGIDLGTSAIKVVAYAQDGTAIASARREVPGSHPEPGHWEVDVLASREAFWSALEAVAGDAAVRADRATALSFSSSGREVFPVAADATPLGPCLMTADTRGDETAARTAAARSPEAWFRLTGHVPRRMDPVNRALWWREHHPEVTARTRWFMNWHEYYALLLSGRPVVDWSDAGTWATYDTASGDWSAERVAETGIDATWLPEVRPNAAPIGTILPEAAARTGLPADLLVVTGAYDAYAASVGSGAVDPGVVGLSCGTWHSFVMPVAAGWPEALVHDGMSVFPHPGPTGFALLVTNPNGMSVVDWARTMTGLSIADLDAGLRKAGPGPGHVFANPGFTPQPHVEASLGFGGQLAGLTLATQPVDIARALLEGIACQFADALDVLRGHGLLPGLVRATGGGARSSWWLQLHADLTALPVEVVAQDEPGAFGAAVLAGVGAGVFPSVSSAVERLVSVGRRFEPDVARGARYADVRHRLATA
jgi:sugar (pentulose or hexulose) kinase